MVCMPAGPEGERAVLLFFELLTFDFPGAGGEGSAFGESPQFAVSVCMPAGQEGERDKLNMFLRFRRFNIPEQRAGGRVSCNLYAIGDIAFGTHASGSEGRARCFLSLFGASAVQISQNGGRGAGLFVDPYNQRFWYAWEWVGRASALNFVFMRGKARGGTLPAAAALLICMPVGRDGPSIVQLSLSVGGRGVELFTDL